MMKRLWWRFWWATPKTFLFPGLYYVHRANKRIVPVPRPSPAPRLIEFPEQTVIIAKDQPEYNPLPAHVFKHDPQGRIACCWQLSFRDRCKVLLTGKLWHQILTFRQPLQPQLLLVDKPDMTVDANN